MANDFFKGLVGFGKGATRTYIGQKSQQAQQDAQMERETARENAAAARASQGIAAAGDRQKTFLEAMATRQEGSDKASVERERLRQAGKKEPSRPDVFLQTMAQMKDPATGQISPDTLKRTRTITGLQYPATIKPGSPEAAAFDAQFESAAPAGGAPGQEAKGPGFLSKMAGAAGQTVSQAGAAVKGAVTGPGFFDKLAGPIGQAAQRITGQGGGPPPPQGSAPKDQAPGQKVSAAWADAYREARRRGLDDQPAMDFANTRSK